MELSTEASRVLNCLAMTDGDAYLFGRRFDDSPLSLVDSAALAQNRMRVDSMPLVERDVAEELVLAGYLEDEALRGESINVAFRITEKGRRECPV
jgi:hypothetical protein